MTDSKCQMPKAVRPLGIRHCSFFSHYGLGISHSLRAVLMRHASKKNLNICPETASNVEMNLDPRARLKPGRLRAKPRDARPFALRALVAAFGLSGILSFAADAPNQWWSLQPVRPGPPPIPNNRNWAKN